MKNKKTLESLKNDLFDLAINSTTIVGGGGSNPNSTWIYSEKEGIFIYYNDSLKPEPIFKITS